MIRRILAAWLKAAFWPPAYAEPWGPLRHALGIVAFMGLVVAITLAVAALYALWRALS